MIPLTGDKQPFCLSRLLCQLPYCPVIHITKNCQLHHNIPRSRSVKLLIYISGTSEAMIHSVSNPLQ